KVATFWKEAQKYSLRYLPTSGLANAFTRSASALFQVKRGSSKLPETCNTKTSFSFLAAWRAASEGVSKNSTLVPKPLQPLSDLASSLAQAGLASNATPRAIDHAKGRIRTSFYACADSNKFKTRQTRKKIAADSCGQTSTQ